MRPSSAIHPLPWGSRFGRERNLSERSDEPALPMPIRDAGTSTKANFCDGHHSFSPKRRAIASVVVVSGGAYAPEGDCHDQDSQWYVRSGRLVARLATDRGLGRPPGNPGATRRLHGRCDHAVQFRYPQQSAHRVVPGVKNVSAHPALPGAVRQALTSHWHRMAARVGADDWNPAMRPSS